jgi:hypothetical protein
VDEDGIKMLWQISNYEEKREYAIKTWEEKRI